MPSARCDTPDTSDLDGYGAKVRKPRERICANN